MKVSVCIPTYNQALFIGQAIRSAVDQAVMPFEIIVSDDKSTDQTREILTQLAKEIQQLKVIYQPVNLGIAKNTDACLRLATGDFIVRLDSDDCLSADYIQKLSTLLIQYPGAGYAHGAVQEIDEKGHFLKERKLFRSTGFQSGDDALKAALKGYRVAANIIMFRKEVLENVNYLTGRPNFGEDFHLAAAIAAIGFGNVYAEEILSYYRVWRDAGNLRQKRKLAEINGLRSVFEEVIEPAFRQKGWSLGKVNKSKAAFACTQADCLSWSVYDASEKEELSFELYKFSTAPSVKLFALAYLNGFGDFISAVNKLKFYSKRLLKVILAR